jgi:tRNA(Ile)-lysidine synthase
MKDAGDPIRPEETEALFAPFADRMPCALAVSGGSDSTALMVLHAEWLSRTGQDPAAHLVLTVDHGLRPDSAAEAQAVAAAAHGLGFRHATLAWHGPKPGTGIQAAARLARYRLLAGCMQAHGLGLLLTAHTLDDQAETVLMRLARGSGLDGLGAMAPLSPLERWPDPGEEGVGPLAIGRPLLGVAKVRLRATLEARGIGWIEDPSNAALEFERARLRAARAQLDALGLTPAMLALSAGRLARARRALDGIVEDLCNPVAGVVRVEACGVIAIDRAGLVGAAEEIALRLLERAMAAAGGASEPVALAKLERIVAALRAGSGESGRRWTLARALVTEAGPVVLVEREPGREPLPQLVLKPGDGGLWDGRFRVSVAPTFAGGAVQVHALGEASLRDLRRRSAIGGEIRPGAAALVPSFWREGRLLAVPPLGYWAVAGGEGELEAVFAGLRGSVTPGERRQLAERAKPGFNQPAR